MKFKPNSDTLQSHMPGHYPFRRKRTIYGTKYLILLNFLLFSFLFASTEAAYFQQTVKYQIQAELFPENHSIEGKETLIYINNSPDTLSVLYFHLYLNKFRARSYFRAFSRREMGGIDIHDIQDKNGDSLHYFIDNTILRLNLKDHPLMPGDSLTLRISFTSRLPEAQSRFGYSGDHYDVGNWYPVPAVYDRLGWHIEQHLDGEFYQEWGNFDVSITVPKGYVVAGSGVLLNPEVLPDSVEFVGRRNEYYASPVRDTARVTYHFQARNVHDFAWSANPDFVLISRKVNQTQLKFFVQNYRYADWQNIVDDVVKAFKFYNKKIGPYPYPELSIVDGFITAGGIEYPTLVMINDYITDLKQLTITVVHEIGHQWFYGMLANNQTRYGWMDEGFTTFYEILATEHLWGREGNLNPPNSSFWQKLFGYDRDARRDARLTYYRYALSGREEPVNMRFDYYQHNPYIPTYDKMGAILFALREILGEQAFDRAIQHYFQKWKMKHPYPSDLFTAFEEATDRNLDWFWDEWLNTTWKSDYQVKKVVSRWKTDINGRYAENWIYIRRNAPIAMPLKMKLTLESGQVLFYEIPVAEWLMTPRSSDMLEPWSPANKNYLAKINLPERVKKVQLDPSFQLLDYNYLNNDNSYLPPVRFYWFRRQYLNPRIDAYTTTLFPFIFYNTVDGAQIGIRSIGNYIYPLYQHSAEFFMGLKSLRPEAWFEWESPLSVNLGQFWYRLNVYSRAGRRGGEVAINNNGNRRAGKQIEVGYRYVQLFNSNYLNYPWSPGKVSSLFFSFSKYALYSRYRNSAFQFNIRGETATYGSDFQFQQIRLNLSYRKTYWHYRDARLFFRAGFSNGDVPLQNLFYLGQASPVQLYQDPYTRARGTIPERLVRKGHYYLPGGGGIISTLQTGTALPLTGKNLLAGGVSLEFWNPFRVFPFDIPILTFMDISLFTRWGTVWNKNLKWNQVGGEAGISLSYDRIPIWLQYFHLSEVQIDFPVWFNKPLNVSERLHFRWAIRLKTELFQ